MKDDLIYNDVSMLELDDDSFIKLSSAKEHLKKVEAAINKVEYIRKALTTNSAAYDYESKENLLVEITISVQPHVAINVINDAKLDLNVLLDQASKELKAL